MIGDAMVRGARAVRWVLARLVIFGMLIGGYFAVTGVQVWLTSRHSEARPVQAIVVMGAAQYDGVPSPDLLARLQDADRLWGKDASQIVVTGYKETGDTYTEAEASATWLNQHGVPMDDIVQVGGNDTWSSLALAAAALHSRGETRILIATDGFHEDRCLAIASELGLQAWPVPATGSPIAGLSSVPYFAKEAVGVALGRIFGYSHLHALG